MKRDLCYTEGLADMQINRKVLGGIRSGQVRF